MTGTTKSCTECGETFTTSRTGYVADVVAITPAERSAA